MDRLAPIVEQVGNENFYTLVLYHCHQQARTDRLVTSGSDRPICSSGTRTGEHGIGTHTRSIHCFSNMGAALDPYDIMNIGKTVPTTTISL